MNTFFFLLLCKNIYTFLINIYLLHQYINIYTCLSVIFIPTYYICSLHCTAPYLPILIIFLRLDFNSEEEKELVEQVTDSTMMCFSLFIVYCLLFTSHFLFCLQFITIYPLFPLLCSFFVISQHIQWYAIITNIFLIIILLYLGVSQCHGGTKRRRQTAPSSKYRMRRARACTCSIIQWTII